MADNIRQLSFLRTKNRIHCRLSFMGASDLAGRVEKIVLPAVAPVARWLPAGSFGRNNPKADIMLVGEGPGKNEDQVGRPFVGAAGQLLDNILGSSRS